MPNKNIVLDASALLAVLNQEPGYKKVEEVLPVAMMSTVNVSEVIAVLNHIGILIDEAEKLVTEIIRDIIPFDAEHALIAAALRKETKSFGLSLGDRSCLALGQTQQARVLTADKIWKQLSVEKVEILLIR